MLIFKKETTPIHGNNRKLYKLQSFLLMNLLVQKIMEVKTYKNIIFKIILCISD